MLTPPPDTTETLVCGLGLALGFMGFLLGTALIVTGLSPRSIRRCRSPGSLRVKGGGHECVGEGKSDSVKSRGEKRGG